MYTFLTSRQTDIVPVMKNQIFNFFYTIKDIIILLVELWNSRKKIWVHIAFHRWGKAIDISRIWVYKIPNAQNPNRIQIFLWEIARNVWRGRTKKNTGWTFQLARELLLHWRAFHSIHELSILCSCYFVYKQYLFDFETNQQSL